MKKGLLVAVVILQLIIAVISTDTVRSLAELAAFLVLAAMLYEKESASIV